MEYLSNKAFNAGGEFCGQLLVGAAINEKNDDFTFFKYIMKRMNLRILITPIHRNCSIYSLLELMHFARTTESCLFAVFFFFFFTYLALLGENVIVASIGEKLLELTCKGIINVKRFIYLSVCILRHR